MPAWITVYLHRAPDLSIDAIKRGIDSADDWTLAEELDIEEDDVTPFLESILGPNDAWFDHDQHRWDPIV